MFVTMEDKKKFICNFEFNSKTVRFFLCVFVRSVSFYRLKHKTVITTTRHVRNGIRFLCRCNI